MSVLPGSLPAEVRAGDAFSFTIQTQLTAGALVFYVLNGAAGNTPKRIRIGGESGVPVDGDGLASFTVSSAETGTWAPATYTWHAFATDAEGDRTELGQGAIRILPDVVNGDPVDPRTYNRKLLDQVRALLQGKALDDVASYTLGSRELTKIPLPELREWEAEMERRVRNENKRRKGQQAARKLPVVFGGR